MPGYWEWLYRPKQEGETEQDKILRKLSFKLPVVIRYNLVFLLLFGFVGTAITKNSKTFFSFYRFMPITVPALCYEEIYRYYLYKMGLPPPTIERNTMADLMVEQKRKEKE